MKKPLADFSYLIQFQLKVTTKQSLSLKIYNLKQRKTLFYKDLVINICFYYYLLIMLKKKCIVSLVTMGDEVITKDILKQN